jgi:hypothetical protein
LGYSMALKKEVVRFSEASIRFYQFIRSDISEYLFVRLHMGTQSPRYDVFSIRMESCVRAFYSPVTCVNRLAFVEAVGTPALSADQLQQLLVE